jgi:hypothetical protein
LAWNDGGIGIDTGSGSPGFIPRPEGNYRHGSFRLWSLCMLMCAMGAIPFASRFLNSSVTIGTGNYGVSTGGPVQT